MRCWSLLGWFFLVVHLQNRLNLTPRRPIHLCFQVHRTNGTLRAHSDIVITIVASHLYLLQCLFHKTTVCVCVCVHLLGAMSPSASLPPAALRSFTSMDRYRYRCCVCEMVQCRCSCLRRAVRPHLAVSDSEAHRASGSSIGARLVGTSTYIYIASAGRRLTNQLWIEVGPLGPRLGLSHRTWTN